MFVKVLIEIAIVVLIAYGIWHEDELVEIENVLKKKVKVKMREFTHFCIEITESLVDLFKVGG